MNANTTLNRNYNGKIWTIGNQLTTSDKTITGFTNTVSTQNSWIRTSAGKIELNESTDFTGAASNSVLQGSGC